MATPAPDDGGYTAADFRRGLDADGAELAARMLNDCREVRRLLRLNKLDCGPVEGVRILLSETGRRWEP